jgi:CRP/FNR family transcriptional regulator, cyclic AMP receptor protein
MNEKVELLRRVPLLAGLSTKDLEEVQRLTDEVEVPAGRELTTEGRAGEEFFLIVSGRVGVVRNGVRLRTMGDGEFLGEIALVDGRVRSATVTTEAPTHLIVLGHREFSTLLETFPAIQAAVLRALAQRVRQTEPEAV